MKITLSYSLLFITVLVSLSRISAGENSYYDDGSDEYETGTERDDYQYKAETDKDDYQYNAGNHEEKNNENQYDVVTEGDKTNENQYDTGTKEDKSSDAGTEGENESHYNARTEEDKPEEYHYEDGTDDYAYNKDQNNENDDNKSDDDSQYYDGTDHEGEYQIYETEDSKSDDNHKSNNKGEDNKEKNDNDYNYYDENDSQEDSYDQQSQNPSIKNYKQEIINPIEIQETQQPSTAKDNRNRLHNSHHSMNSPIQKALHSYTEITKLELDAAKILSSFKKGNKKTRKFIQNVLKALDAINKAKEKQFHGFDWPEDVVSMLKRFHPNKSNTYIARFLCHYYQGYSGAKKQYLRMKVRILSNENTEPQHERKRRNSHNVAKRRKHSRKHRQHRKRPTMMKQHNHHTTTNDDEFNSQNHKDHKNEMKLDQKDNFNYCDTCTMKDNEEVCGNDGRTYNSLCHAVNCGGLQYTDVRLGKCEERNPCDANTCKSHQICMPKINPTCFSLYDKEGNQVPCHQYKCISKRHCEKPKHPRQVCGNNGHTYTSLCSLYQSGTTLAYHGACNSDKCSREVCGSNGVTFATSCHAKERGVRIDYTGKCLLAEDWLQKETCHNVRRSEKCPKIPPLCKKWIIPEGSCCPVCGTFYSEKERKSYPGVAVSTQPDTKALAKMGNANKLKVIQKFIKQRLIPHESRDKCHTSVTYSYDKLLTIVLEPYNNEVESICENAAMKLADKINNPTSSHHSHMIKSLGPAKYHSPSSGNLQDIMNS